MSHKIFVFFSCIFLGGDRTGWSTDLILLQINSIIDSTADDLDCAIPVIIVYYLLYIFLIPGAIVFFTLSSQSINGHILIVTLYENKIKYYQRELSIQSPDFIHPIKELSNFGKFKVAKFWLCL